MLTTLLSRIFKIFWFYKLVFTRIVPRTAQDSVKLVLCSPVGSPSIFGNIRTGLVLGPSPDKPRTGTRPDFKALTTTDNMISTETAHLAAGQWDS